MQYAKRQFSPRFNVYVGDVLKILQAFHHKSNI
jgi:hypothetical protein